MALTYEQSANLMQDVAFISRVKIACLNFARFIFDESSSVSAHSARARWANQTFMNPDGAAQQTTPLVVMDPAIQQDGAVVSDAVLQTAVETAVNKLL